MACLLFCIGCIDIDIDISDILAPRVCWSPDGKKIVFRSFYESSKNEEIWEIWLCDIYKDKSKLIARARGTKEIPVPLSHPIFSPNGKYISFFRAESMEGEEIAAEVVLHSLRDDREKTVASFGFHTAYYILCVNYPLFSLRGDEIYYLSSYRDKVGDHKYTINSVNIKTGKRYELIKDTETDFFLLESLENDVLCLEWAKDSERVLLINTKGKKNLILEQKMEPEKKSIMYGSSPSFFAFEPGKKDFFVIRQTSKNNGARLRDYLHLKPGRNYCNLQKLPLKKRVTCLRTITTGGGSEIGCILFARREIASELNNSIFSYDLKSGEEKTVIDEKVYVGYNTWPSCSPDGRWLAFGSSTEHGGIPRVIEISTGKEKPLLLDEENTALRWRYNTGKIKKLFDSKEDTLKIKKAAEKHIEDIDIFLDAYPKSKYSRDAHEGKIYCFFHLNDFEKAFKVHEAYSKNFFYTFTLAREYSNRLKFSFALGHYEKTLNLFGCYPPCPCENCPINIVKEINSEVVRLGNYIELAKLIEGEGVKGVVSDPYYKLARLYYAEFLDITKGPGKLIKILDEFPYCPQAVAAKRLFNEIKDIYLQSTHFAQEPVGQPN